MFLAISFIHSVYVGFFTRKNRSNHQRCSGRKGVFRNSAKFTGRHLCQSLYFNKVAGLRPAPLLKQRHWYRCFPVNFTKFLRTPFLQNTSRQLLLKEQKQPLKVLCKTSILKNICERLLLKENKPFSKSKIFKSLCI